MTNKIRVIVSVNQTTKTYHLEGDQDSVKARGMELHG